VYWLVKKDGFYRSWDKASWVLEDPWETEWFLMFVFAVVSEQVH
jgi:hypothetical protein